MQSPKFIYANSTENRKKWEENKKSIRAHFNQMDGVNTFHKFQMYISVIAQRS